MENRCKDCKHWGRYFDAVCDSPCDLFEVEASADDDQGLEVFLKTSPDFGCVCFEAKP